MRTATITVEFSESVTGFTSSDLTATGGTLSDIYRIRYNIYSNPYSIYNSTTNAVVSVAANVATDIASETTTLAATPITILVDTVAPTLLHNRCNISIESPTNDTTPTVTVSGIAIS